MTAADGPVELRVVLSSVNTELLTLDGLREVRMESTVRTMCSDA